MIDEKTIAQWRRLAEAASTSGWTLGSETSTLVRCANGNATIIATKRIDAEFVVAARQALPALLDECERLRALLVEARNRIACNLSTHPSHDELCARIDSIISPVAEGGSGEGKL